MGIVNRNRRKRKRINEHIEMEEWKDHFMRLLEGVESRVMKGGESRERGEEEGEMEEKIDRGELERVLRKKKNGKANGIDGIPAEVWKYEGKELESWVWEFCNSIWRGEG